MSADNFVGVIAGEKDSLGRVSAWYVSHGSMSNIEDPERELEWKDYVRANKLPYPTRESALAAAHDKLKKESENYNTLSGCEYGVIEL